MTEKFYTILTNVGKASIANATALGGKVDFKYMALGDGNGNYYNPTETQTELKNEVYRTQINHVQLDEENLNWVTLTIVIPTSIGGFTVREVGAFDTEGNLLVIGKYPETYKPKLEEGSGKDLTVNMILEVSNTSVVNLKIDPTVILATKKDIDILSNRITKNETDITELKEGSTVIEELETENKTLAGAINEIKTDLDAHKADYVQQLGTTELATTDKTLKGAINEVFTNGNSVKSNTVDALLSVDGSLPITSDSTWNDIITQIGNISALLPTIPGNNIVLQSLIEVSQQSTSYRKLKEIQVNSYGVLRVSYSLSSPVTGGAKANIYINDIPAGIERTATTNYVNYSEDIEVYEGDLVQVYGQGVNIGGAVRRVDIKDFTIGIGLDFDYGTVII